MSQSSKLHSAPLGKISDYPEQYDHTLLFAVPRADKRAELSIEQPLPFFGLDIWQAWEISWLNKKGKPVVAVGEFRIPAESPNIIESKSFKLYLNSFNQENFSSAEQVEAIMATDLSVCAGAEVSANLMTLEQASNKWPLGSVDGVLIDNLDVYANKYQTDSSLLKRTTGGRLVEETLVSHLLKSNCPVTGQPDWGSLVVRYKGNQINHESLLQYIISFRQHTEFHEQCVERVYTDIHNLLNPDYLQVFARYVRRGGLDINPYRSSTPEDFLNQRFVRQ